MTTESEIIEDGHGVSPEESRAAFSLAGIFSLRMLGLFLIMPVFALYAEELEGVTPFLVGVAIGVYGLTQALLQIPLGMLSDRIGRKPVIIAGLLMFAVGSVVAATSDTIWGVILGRALQGSGAIAAVIMALAADLSREENRTKIMAVIGISIGIAFTVSLVLGPLLDGWIGVSGIFWLTALLALSGIVVTIFLVPTPRESHFHRDTEPVPAQFGQALSNPELLRLNLGIMVLHMVLPALFLSVPLALRDYIGMESSSHWQLYLPVMLLSMLLMVPFIVIAERQGKMKQVLLGAILLLAVAEFGLYFLHQGLFGLGLMLLLFFLGFNLLEAMLPSLVSKVAPAAGKGTAMGIYSTSQFTGAFIGGMLGGWVQGCFGIEGVFIFGTLVTLLWLLVASRMAPPSSYSSYLLRVGELDEARATALQAQLLGIKGVGEAAVVAADGIAYLKIDKSEIDMAEISALSSFPS